MEKICNHYKGISFTLVNIWSDSEHKDVLECRIKSETWLMLSHASSLWTEGDS